MNSFSWKPQFETGLEIVDAQHHRLVDLINRYGELVASGQAVRSHAITALLGELAHYATHHFQDEEQLMRQLALDSRHYDHHKLAHEEFLQEVTRMQGAMTSTPEAENLLRFLTHWLAYHILGTDQAMANQIRAIRLGKSPTSAFDDDAARHRQAFKIRVIRRIADLIIAVGKNYFAAVARRRKRERRTNRNGVVGFAVAARAEIAAITQIALDHQEYLGETIAEIAREKAAIIHENTVEKVL